MENYVLNETFCYARKAAKGVGYLQQCTNKKKHGDYCGKHTNCNNPFTILCSTNKSQVVQVKIGEPQEIKVKKVEDIIDVHRVENTMNFPFDKDRYQNKTDFYNFEDIEMIPLEFFYEHQEGNQLYAFDIRTLHDYMEACNQLEPIKNPYTHVDFSQDTISEIKKIHKKFSKNHLLNDYKEAVDLNPEKQLEWRVLEVFQKINQLGHYAEYKWFWNLNLAQLKKMYHELEDLWNYRLFLTQTQKLKIIHGYFPFTHYTVTIFNKINVLNDARKVFIGEMDKFVTMGKLDGKNGNDNKYTGSIIVLTALVLVSHDAANGLPHLVPIID